MNRRGQRNIPKLYKDIMISKRQLIDLRQTLNQTYSRLGRPNHKPSTSTINSNIKNKLCYNCNTYTNPGLPHKCSAPPQQQHKCSICYQHFQTKKQLSSHLKQNHHQCKRCLEKHNENPEIHEAQFCGEKRIQCENCGARVKRKDLNQHVQGCCFHICSKCKKGIYYKAYGYHLAKCNDYQQNDLNRTKRITKKQTISFKTVKENRYFPCSIKK